MYFHMIRRSLLVCLVLVFAGCDELRHIAGQPGGHRPLTNQEVIDGLKQALVVGSDSAASRLSAADGYYRNELVRILLPPEAEVITRNLSYLPGGEQLVEDVILRINRAAEDAARGAGPIFARAIADMSIRDGFDILRGERDAATQYLRIHTYDALYGLYQPSIQRSLDKEIVGGVSTNEAWNTLTGQWNRLASSAAGRLASLERVDTQLDDYLTSKALDGLFVHLAIEEEKIRTDPAARVTDLLRRVFGEQRAV